MNTIQDFDRELEAKQQLFQRLHGEIEQLRMERAFELQRLAREQSRSQVHLPSQGRANRGFSQSMGDGLQAGWCAASPVSRSTQNRSPRNAALWSA
jgi:hypothetical protein